MGWNIRTIETQIHHKLVIDFNGKRVTGASNCIQLLVHAAPIQLIVMGV